LHTFLNNLKTIKDVDLSIAKLKTVVQWTPLIQKALLFCINAHRNQFRKSGEPYVIHPILVSTITAYFSHDEHMVISALLHDVVEDSKFSREDILVNFGEDVAYIVDGLTKISSQASTFRKMLIASRDDIRVLVIKLCDRVHNMLTLDALPHTKQIRISEETLNVYAPIAHRLGMSIIKNSLEDLGFYYLYPKEYKEIENYIKKYQQKIQLSFNHFVSQTKDILSSKGYKDTNVQISSRIKHYYSIYLKMQRKGINIDEVLDLQAIRIIVDSELDCYQVLGLIHIKYKPLLARFKDYIAIPKENGYKTIHTTIFYDSKIYEVQIRTINMHHIAQYGIAAHWKYKNGENSGDDIKLDWLHALELNSDDIEEFYSDAKQDLYSEEVVVYSPKGDMFTLPRGATAYDFAYEIHTDVGEKALVAIINKEKKPLLTQLVSGDIVFIDTGIDSTPRCSWINMVTTSKSKKAIKNLCAKRIRYISELTGQNILNTIFVDFEFNVINDIDISILRKIPYDLDYFKNTKRIIEQKIFDKNKIKNLLFKSITIKNIVINSNFTINNVLFDHCCHPKFGDNIVAFKDDKTAIIHHQLCDNAYKKIENHDKMLFCQWIKDKFYTYKMVVSLPNTQGELARLLTYLAFCKITILFIEYGKDKHAQNQYCAIDFEINDKDKKKVRKIVEKKTKIIEFYGVLDAYKG